MSYEITLNFYYQTFDSFKQKGALIIQNLFAGGRMIDYAKFHGYGIILTNGHKADKITIEDLDKFSRSKTNCIIFDTVNKTKYNKVFVYQSINRENSYYGIVGLKNNGESVHVYNIELDYAKLVINLLRMIK